jgi:hypothetical protein
MFKLSAKAKRFARFLTVTTVASASALALATPALAAGNPQASAPVYDCQLFAFEPWLSANGDVITGLGASLCLGTGWQDQKLVVSIEERPFPTLYVVKAQASTGYTSLPLLLKTVSWNCAGTGTHLYTIETSWYGINGSVYSYKFSSETVSITCNAPA